VFQLFASSLIGLFPSIISIFKSIYSLMQRDGLSLEMHKVGPSPRSSAAVAFSQPCAFQEKVLLGWAQIINASKNGNNE